MSIILFSTRSGHFSGEQTVAIKKVVKRVIQGQVCTSDHQLNIVFPIGERALSNSLVGRA